MQSLLLRLNHPNKRQAVLPLQRRPSRLPQLLRFSQLHRLRCSLRSQRNRMQSGQLSLLDQHSNQHHLHSLHRQVLPFRLFMFILLHPQVSHLQHVNRNTRLFNMRSRLLPFKLFLCFLLSISAQVPDLQHIDRNSSVSDLRIGL